VILSRWGADLAAGINVAEQDASARMSPKARLCNEGNALP
jgi:hypothetical protein